MSLVNVLFPQCNVPYFSMEEKTASFCSSSNAAMVAVIVAVICLVVVIMVHFAFNKKLENEEEEKKRKTNFIPLIVGFIVSVFVVLGIYFFTRFYGMSKWRGQKETDAALQKAGVNSSDRFRMMNERENTQMMADAYRQPNSANAGVAGFLGGLLGSAIGKKI